MTLLALGAKCGGLGASGWYWMSSNEASSGSSSSIRRISSLAVLMQELQLPDRFHRILPSKHSIHIHKFVRVKQHVAQVGQGAAVELGFGVGAEILVLIEQILPLGLKPLGDEQHRLLALFFGRRAQQREPIGAIDLPAQIVPR